MSTAGRSIVSLLDRPLARKVWKGPVGRKVRRSRPYRRMLILRKRRLADAARRDSPTAFDDVSTFCLLIGHTKSGGSLLGAMLDAHPSVIFGEEVDIVELCSAGFTPDQIFRTLERSARREAMRGRVTARRLGGYSLAMPGWQGLHDHPTVVGVSRAGPTTRLLGSSASALDDFLGTFEDQRIVALHIVRRPRDSVAAMVLRSGRDLPDAIADYAAQCERLEHLRNRLPDVCTIHYEELTGSTSRTLTLLLEHLEVEVMDAHIESCTALIDRSRTPESELIDWDASATAALGAVAQRFDFLEPYRA